MPSLAETFERALDDIQSRVFSVQISEDTADLKTAQGFSKAPLAVAFSGGLDSTALLYLAKQYAQKHHQQLWAFHIHHGISPNADSWLNHCRQICGQLSINFEAVKVQLDTQRGEGIEAEARQKRYQALKSLCHLHQIPLLLTAHHQNDQAETILMQLMRGTGIAGLAGMEDCVPLRSEESVPDIYLGRPLLGISRQSLEEWCASQQISHIEDESNSDTRYTRNAIRHQIMPMLAEHFPGFEQRLSGTAVHLQSASGLLVALAESDLQQCQTADQALDMKQVRALSADRIDNLLQYWLMKHQVRIPSVAWFHEMRRQLMSTDHDAKTELKMDGKVIRKYRDKVTMTEQKTERHPPENPISFNWNGEPSIQFRTWYGRLVFELGETGFDIDWFRGRIFSLRPYLGSATLKLEGRPTKDMKTLYQEAGISGEERRFMPSIWFEDALIYAAKIGQSAQYQGKSGKCVQLRWETLS